MAGSPTLAVALWSQPGRLFNLLGVLAVVVGAIAVAVAAITALVAASGLWRGRRKASSRRRTGGHEDDQLQPRQRALGRAGQPYRLSPSASAPGRLVPAQRPSGEFSPRRPQALAELARRQRADGAS